MTDAHFAPNLAVFTTGNGQQVEVREIPATDRQVRIECEQITGTFSPREATQILELLNAPKAVIAYAGPPF